MWNEDDNKLIEMFEESNLTNQKPLFCPNCETKNIHIFFYKFDSDHGSAWIWCSKCKHYTHFTCKVPFWWINLPSINIDMLYSEPDILEENKQLIDNHFNKLIK